MFSRLPAMPLVLLALATPVVAAAEPETFSGVLAMEHLEAICRLGPRPSWSDGMRRQRAMLAAHFREAGATISGQAFQIRDRRSGQPVHIENLVASWHPDRDERILLAAHYDTRPFPDRDPVDPRGVFIGANDGASGVALLMELGRFMPALAGPLGVDFVLFDSARSPRRRRNTERQPRKLRHQPAHKRGFAGARRSRKNEELAGGHVAGC